MAYRMLSDKELIAVMDLLYVAGIDVDHIPFYIGEAEGDAEMQGRATISLFLPQWIGGNKPHPRGNVESLDHYRRKRLFSAK